MEHFNNIWLDKLGRHGDDFRVHDRAMLNRPEIIFAGDHIIIDFCAYITVEMHMKNWIHIAPFASVIGGASATMIMGWFTNIAAGGRVICATDNFKDSLLSPHIPIENRTVINEPVIFEDFSTLGTNATCMPGVRLAEGSVIGANAVVTKDTEPWGIYVGAPAKIIGYRDREKILFNARQLGYDN